MRKKNQGVQIVLGIETSCDETGIALYDGDRGLLAESLHSQIGTHQRYGGVVPELAARDHVRKLLPLVQQTLTQAQLSLADLDGIAYTAGPGLLGAVMVGASFARALAWGLGLPSLGVHHMEGHLFAPLLENLAPDVPFVALLISGGHTQLVDVARLGDYHLLGESIDDAAGEAFDKTAKLLGLDYPGGPEIERLATSGDPKAYNFPRPMLNQPHFDFSFSGLKTSVLRAFEQSDKSFKARANIAASFQAAAIDTLVSKCQRALQHTHRQRLIVAGGVSANQALRQTFNQRLQQDTQIYYPRLAFCTDNGAMIAYAGYLRLVGGEQDDLQIHARARWPLETLKLIE